MPNHTIYVRIEDEAKWQALGDKSGWIRQKLQEDEYQGLEKFMQPPGYNVIPKPPELSDYRWQQHLRDHLGKAPHEAS